MPARRILLPLLLASSWPVTSPAQEHARVQALIDSSSNALSSGNIQAGLALADQALAAATGDSLRVAEALVARSNGQLQASRYEKAIQDLQGALRIYERFGDRKGMASVYNSMGSVHFYDGNYPQAEGYYARSLRLYQEAGDSGQVAMLYGNLGAVQENEGHLDSALSYQRRHLALRKASDDKIWLPICYINMGSCFEKMGVLDSARHYLEAGLGLFREAGIKPLSYIDGLRLLGQLHVHAGRPAAGLRICDEALNLADGASDLVMQELCYECLYEAHQALGNPSKALAMYKRFITIRDSISGEQRSKNLLRMELTFAFQRERLADSLKQAEEQHQASLAYQYGLAHERYQKRFSYVAALAILMLAVGLWRRLRHIQRSRRIIQQERDRSDRLLRNILPGPIADELKAHGRVQVREVAGVSILFTDFNEFTRLSERMGPQDLVAEIDACYRAFDAMVARHGLEKIKTIGDSYMCAGGLPDPRPSSAADTVRAALEMQDWLKARAKAREAQGLPAFHMRVGVHTGNVVAGVVGEAKFQYDIWGDTVNTAARMESAGATGEVNISHATYEQVRDDPSLFFMPRGAVPTKGKGDILMYFVRRAAAGA